MILDGEPTGCTLTMSIKCTNPGVADCMCGLPLACCIAFLYTLVTAAGSSQLDYKPL